MWLKNDEALYGGAAGGGKSDALLMAALQYVDVPGYAALILRRWYPDLSQEGGLIPRSMEWLGPTDARWDERLKRWSFPSGATLSLRDMENEKAKFKHSGSEYQFIGFDQVEQFTRTMYTFMFSRLRKRANLPVPLRMRSTANPLGPHVAWVRARFRPEGPPIPGRPFIASSIKDNPHIDQESYIKSLMHLDSVARMQLMEGDWTVREQGGIFKREWFQKFVDREPKGCTYFRYWDLAASEAGSGDPDYTVGVKMAVDPDGEYYVVDVRRFRETALRTNILMKQAAKTDGINVQIGIEQVGGAGKRDFDQIVVNVLNGYSVQPDKVGSSSGDKATRAKPFASMAENGHVYLVRATWNEAFIDELEAFPHGSHDDQVDAAGGSFRLLAVPDLEIDFV